MSNNTVTITQPATDGSQTLTVGTGGTFVLGTVALPPVPTTNGTYNLVVSGGVATWTVVS